MLSVPAGVKLRRTWPQRLFLSLATLVALTCFASAGALFYVDSKTGQIQHVRLSHALTGNDDLDGAKQPMNILMVGVDVADGLPEDDPRRAERDEQGISGLRSDTIMVLRIMPEQDRVALVSFPRDLWVEIAGTGRNDKINTALTVGGPATLIDTIQDNFAIPLDHYVQVDFAQFEQLVEVVDGVKVYFDTPVRDVYTGLDIPEPGCVTLHGTQALAYARSRYYEYYDEDSEDWLYDPTVGPGSHQPSAGLHPQGAGPGSDQGGSQPLHAQPTGQHRPAGSGARRGVRRR